MASRLRYLAMLILLLLPLQNIVTLDNAAPQNQASISGKIIDAETGLPIFNATILLWDIDTFEQPRPGAGIYFTDMNGEYNISGSYLKVKHNFWMYAYKGDFAAGTIDYVPSVRKVIYFETLEERDMSFSLIKGAVVEWEGIPFLVQSPSPEERTGIIRVLTENQPNASFMTEYGGVIDGWFLGLDRRTVIVPANTPVVLEAEVWYSTIEQGRIVADTGIFRLYNGSLPFILPQHQIVTIKIASYSLRGGLDYVQSNYVNVSSQLDNAQSIGFVIFDERRALTSAQERMIEASSLLMRAKSDDEFEEVWRTLRDVLSQIHLISMTLDFKKLVSKTSASYLSAIMAAFSIVLAFFFFEAEKKKMLSSIAIYAIFLVCLYFMYPGAHIVIDENALLFLESAAASFLGVTVVVFGIPQVWKEQRLEGEVSWRSSLSVIFSMGKRQIRRNRIRGFFTILSIVILVLAFTSLTSFGTAFGVVSDKLTGSAPSDGVMVKRMVNQTSLLFSPLGLSDPTVLSKIFSIDSVALRLRNIPNSNPVVRLVNLKTGASWFIYGVLGITPSIEAMYTHINDTVEGGYLSDSRVDDILIPRNAASSLGTEVGEILSLEVLGTRATSNFTVTGLIDDTRYTNMIDMDGTPFGPSRLLEDGSARRCNSTEIVVLNWEAAENLQEMINVRQPTGAPQFVVLSDFVFRPSSLVANIDSIAKTLIFVFNYDVFVSINRVITYYHIGSYIELKGAAELLIPLVMVGLNVSMVMMNSVYERRKEIRTLSMLGLNPTHIGLIFVAEAVVMGMVGGSLGYLFGLGFYRIMVLFGQELMVREKLEWWWSALGFALALIASVLSAIRPAALAVSTYTPSKIKKVKRTEEETKDRKEEIFKAYQTRDLGMPVKVLPNEKEFFISFFLDRLVELKEGYLERIENIENIPEIENVKGELIKTIKFNYSFGTPGRERSTKNSLTLIKGRQEDYYRIRLTTEPAVTGVPESTIERTINFVHEATIYWAKNKDKFISAV